MGPIAMIPRRGVYHCHSDWSYDGKSTLKEYRCWALAHQIRWVIFTEHADGFTPERWQDYLDVCAAVSDDEFEAIPGLEYELATDKHIHIGCWGSAALPSVQSVTAEQLLDLKKRDPDIVTVLHHPRNIWRQVPPELYDAIDCVEVWNIKNDFHYAPYRSNLQRSRKLARPGIWGSDMHGTDDRHAWFTTGLSDPGRAFRDGQCEFHFRPYRQFETLLAEAHRTAYSLLRTAARKMHLRADPALVRRLKGK